MSKTIDQLPGATSLTGTETLPINQAGVTKHANINMIQGFIATLFEAAGAVASGMAGHLAAYVHGDIAHVNRAALNLVAGTNTGDQDISGLALKASPVLTGTPTAPTAAQGTKTTQLATTQFVLDNAAMSYTGTFEPGTKYANMFWYNTTDNSIQQRNAANTAWVYKGPIDKVYDGITPLIISYVGSWSYTPMIVLLPPAGVEAADTMLTTTGLKFIADFYYSESLGLPGLTLTMLSFTDLSGTTGLFQFSSALSLTSLIMAEFGQCGGAFTLSGMPVLTTINCPKLAIVGASMTLSGLDVVTTPLFPNLKTIIGDLSITTNAGLMSLDFPALQIIGGHVMISNDALLTSLNLPQLRTTNNLTLSFLAALTSFSAPLLEYTKILQLSYMQTLATVDMPALVFCGGMIFTSSTAALTTVTIGSTLKTVTGDVIFSSCALTQATVDHILARLAALNGTNGTTAYSSKIVTLTGTSATPSAAGLASKAILVGRGCTVTHN